MNDPVWESRHWRGFPRLHGDQSADVCVVGLGGSGLAAIDEALIEGKSVVGIDSGPIAGEAAGRNGGFLLAGMALFYHEARSRWGRERALRVYRETQRELETILATPTARRVGSLRIAATEDELSDISAELRALTEDGLEGESYEGPEGQGLLIPGNGVCNPMARCRAEALRLSRGGASLYEGSPAVAVDTGIVRTPHGAIEAERVVVAIDGRLESLFPQLQSRLRTARLEMLATEPIPPRSNRPVYTSFGYVYWQQLEDGRLALGGMRDRHLEESWTIDPGPSEAIQLELDKALASMGVHAEVTHRWAGHSAYTEDRTPVFEELRPGVWVVGGYSGHGNVLGAVYARAAVRAALTGSKEELL